MRILDEIHKENIDSMVVLNPKNIAYLSGFNPSSFSVLILKDEPVLLTSKMDFEDASLNTSIPLEEFKSLDKIKDYLNGVIGIEKSITLGVYRKLKISPIFEVKITDAVERLRRIKSGEEIQNIEKAIDIAESAIKDIDFDSQRSENEIAAQIEYNMRIMGSKKASFDTIVASGKRSSLPHADVSNKPLNMPVVIDWGATYNNYCSDTTRTLIETEKQEEIFEIVLEAQKSAIDVIRPGIKASYVDKVARDVIEEYGYGDYFLHSTGHGVGLEIHESPSLSSNETIKLEKNMVVTVEPGIYLKDEFGIRIEDMVLIKNKAKVLNKIKNKI
ncbi:MAG: aminopeptidase P family protein [Methanobacterium sp.]|nr:aminopeptidase P family protein [Methanobacterium sp.]